MSDKLIYVASPLGFYEAGRHFLVNELLPIFHESGYGYIDPWTHAPSDTLNIIQQLPYGIERKSAYAALNKQIGAQNTSWINKSVGILAVLDGADVDSGTASEIGYCAGKSKPILGYRSDFRLAADNEGGIVNLQVEYFIHMHGGIIANTLTDVKKYLQIVFQ